MAHDFKRFPELTNRQAELYYWDSPHRQIFEDFHARVVKVTDGDTIRVSVDFRDFDFPIRFLDIDAPEIKEPNGEKVQRYLASRILGRRIDVDINPRNRVDRWGRLLGKISEGGIDMGDDMLRQGMVTRFDKRDEGEIPTL
jgi:endonuclease YncB( thermonuclease family)